MFALLSGSRSSVFRGLDLAAKPVVTSRPLFASLPAAVPQPASIFFEEIRRRQEQRIEGALEAWDNAKNLLEEAIALVEAREKAYAAVVSDVRHKLEAVDLVMSLGEAGSSPPPIRSSAPKQLLPLARLR